MTSHQSFHVDFNAHHDKSIEPALPENFWNLLYIASELSYIYEKI